MDRREVLRMTLATGASLALLGHLNAQDLGSRPMVSQDEDPELAKAVTEGRKYFIQRCNVQIPLLVALESDIRSGDLEAARRSYVESRPPYEEIETLAASFEETDRDIDARPYAFDGGEDDPEFRGFHKIEVLLYAYSDTRSALPYAAELIESVRKLKGELEDGTRFNAKGQFSGMFALTNEVSAKKVSSEEETWSDQTLLIFRHNWIGVYSQYKPFDPIVSRADEGVSESVKSAYHEAMGLLTDHFRSGSAAGTPYSKIGIRERRQMADASNRFRDAILASAQALHIDIG